jgi:tetratricopeptide (TPR) repeat protein
VFVHPKKREIITGMRSTFRLGVLAALFTAHGLSVAQAVAPQSTTEGVASIVTALRTGQFDEALERLRPELQRDPANQQLWTLQGIALSGKGDKKDALGAFRHALGISSNYMPALEGAAQIEYENDDKDATALLEHILQLHPGDVTSHAMLAEIAYRRGDCAAAVPHFDRSDSLLDSQPGALQHYGDCLVRLKETERAISIFQRALSQPSADVHARYRLATVQMMAQHPQDAIATLQPLLQDTSSDAAVLELAASAYEADKNTPEAVRLLRHAIVLNPHQTNLYVDFADISLDHQSYQVGVDMLDAGLKAGPQAAPLYVARGILYVQLAQYDKAEADFEKAEALDPRQSMVSAAEGLAAVQENDPDRALRIVQKKLAKKHDDPFLLYAQAEILAQRGPDPGGSEFREAIESAKRAVSLRPNLGEARDLLAKLYLQSGQNGAAIDQCRKALIIDPKDQTALYHLIQALRKSGRQDEVPDLLKRLAALRLQGTKDESEHNRYKLVEAKSPPMENQKP